MTHHDDALDTARHDEDGHPICDDDFCPGYPDCPDCRGLREAEWQRYETTEGNDRTA